MAATLGALATTASLLALDRIYPPDLSRYEARSLEIRDADGRLLRAFTTADGKWRLKSTVDDVDPLYLALLKSYEDKRFDSHAGVDPIAVLRAAEQWISHRRIVSGASTLSMQAARLLEQERGTRRSLGAKLRQSARALQLEWRYSKAEILSIYLTLAPFGGNIEGVRAASLSYFGKEPRRLTAAEAALLVALPQSPERRRPDRRPEQARAARDVVLARALERGVIPASVAAHATQAAAPDRRLAMPFVAPHVAQYLVARTPRGSIVTTTLRREIQDPAARLATDERTRLGDGADIAIVIIDNRRHSIAAWHGGGFFGRQGQVDLVRARRSPGSTLKPLIYGIAFDDRVAHPDTLIDDVPLRFGEWMPRNFDRAHQGTVSVRHALQQSLNVPAVAMLERIGAQRFLAMLRQAGVSPALPRTGDLGGSLAIGLGGVAISPLELATLYAGLANDGVVVKPRLIADEAEGPGMRLIGAPAAWQIADALANAPMPDGWASLPRSYDGRRTGGRQIAFKTGTSYGFRDAWAAGYSGAYTVVVWVGQADGTPRPGAFGRETALPILLKMFDRLPGELASRPKPPPDTLLVARNADLPPALRRFRGPAARMAAATAAPTRPTGANIVAPASKPPRILYPPAAAVIDLGADDAIVPLQADGGSGQLRWLIDGKPLPPDRFAKDQTWRPDGPGVTQITVVDSQGRSASALVRILARP
ncbi:MAG: penicillin-binding protein 1C [Alphaproteobacteria bacterium]|nr:penicillin-binding protein 1C [Alphaproteobacteria bacterium]MCW5739355.1 penicillin-binding protein 1C [Alphaproteobacteria bacterium]